ncbi:hypothetical protein DPMN_142538 [Dreissena polymorpha]|uniref:Uncharacterized protein n=1 Tax=Dreissena polymorpha TaxID=45954 RepID=A0A9D4GBH2_DREPO|nr:hypothetical protein DPMN_142538 [Dreissena polymorpha]
MVHRFQSVIFPQRLVDHALLDDVVSLSSASSHGHFRDEMESLVQVIVKYSVPCLQSAFILERSFVLGQLGRGQRQRAMHG